MKGHSYFPLLIGWSTPSPLEYQLLEHKGPSPQCQQELTLWHSTEGSEWQRGGVDGQITSIHLKLHLWRTGCCEKSEIVVTAVVWYSAELVPVPGSQKKALWIYLPVLTPSWLSDPTWSLFTPCVSFQDIVGVVSEGQAEVWEPVLSRLRLWPRRLSASPSLQEGNVVPAPSQFWRGWNSGEIRPGFGLGFNIGRIPSRLCTGSWFWISWF